jgi:hypothetical protein
VVRRDLKPANIPVSTQGEPKLLDLASSKLLDMKTKFDDAEHAHVYTGLHPPTGLKDAVFQAQNCLHKYNRKDLKMNHG